MIKTNPKTAYGDLPQEDKAEEKAEKTPAKSKEFYYLPKYVRDHIDHAFPGGSSTERGAGVSPLKRVDSQNTSRV
jgi:hypothetical protein